MFKNYTNLYKTNKTIKNSAEPIGKTLEYIKASGTLDGDFKLKEDSKKMKALMDEFFKSFLEEALSSINLTGLDKYNDVYNTDSEDRKKALEVQELDLRKQIEKHFKSFPVYHKFFGKAFIVDVMADFLKGREESEYIEEFANFTTYFKKYFDTRKNLFISDDKTNTVANRIINENLPMFMYNIQVFNKAEEVISDKIKDMAGNYMDILKGRNIKDLFGIDAYSNTVSQSQITSYNTIIGGFTTSTGKVKGLNEIINEHNQTVEKKDRLPMFKCLYKQLLSERETLSFVDNKINSNDEALALVENYIDKYEDNVLSRFDDTSAFGLMLRLDEYDLSKIYITENNLHTISVKLFGNHSAITDALYEAYDKEHENVKKTNKYYTEREKAVVKDSHSIEYINSIIGEIEEDICVEDYFATALNYDKFRTSLDIFNRFLTKTDNDIKNNVESVKDLLDDIIAIERLYKLLTTDKTDIDDVFYSKFEEIYTALKEIVPVYNKVRNFITQKPVTLEKVKLNFENPSFLGGWSVTQEREKGGLLFRDDNFYYIGVIPKHSRAIFKDYPAPTDNDDVLYKMSFQQTADAGKVVQNLMVIDGITQQKNGRVEKSGPNAGENVVLEELKNKYLPEEINEIRKKRSYSASSENFNKEDLTKYIDYYKERIIENFPQYDFNFKDSSEYDTFPSFTDEINEQAYKLEFIEISKSHIMKLVDEGLLYLFRIYNKDFSPNSMGTPQLHTMYFKMLFNEDNLKSLTYKLNSASEMFYRKDKDKFYIHMSISLNYKSEGLKNINKRVWETIRNNEDINILSVSTGNNNVLYYTVINPKGEVLENGSLNKIKNIKGFERDYNELFAVREKEKNDARINWNPIGSSQNLKEGYASQVVPKVIELMVKYNAIVVLEDADSINNRNTDKHIYQSFCNALASKLSFYVDKKKDINELGGYLKALQLANEPEQGASFIQNGFIFNIGGYKTYIDPTTGYSNEVYLQYSNKKRAEEILGKLNLVYNGKEYVLNINYEDFMDCSNIGKTIWSIHSDGIKTAVRINNGKKVYEAINPTSELNDLFTEYEIDIKEDILKQAVAKDSKILYVRIFEIFNAMMRLVNFSSEHPTSYISSPIEGDSGRFTTLKDEKLVEADSVKCYNMARKGLILLDRIRNEEKPKLSMTNKDWLEHVQK